MDKQFYEVIKAFPGSPDGARTYRYEVGDIVPLPGLPFSDELAEVAQKEKWVKRYRPASTRRPRKGTAPAAPPEAPAPDDTTLAAPATAPAPPTTGTPDRPEEEAS